MGEKIAANSQLIVGMAKQSVNRAYETTLQEGKLHGIVRLKFGRVRGDSSRIRSPFVQLVVRDIVISVGLEKSQKKYIKLFFIHFYLVVF